MITEQDLQAAIAECQGKRNPDANTCLKLASYYVIKDHMYGEQPKVQKAPERILPAYSYASAPEPVENIGKYGDTEFARCIEGRKADEIWPIMVELMEVLNATDQRLYAGVMRKIDS